MLEKNLDRFCAGLIAVGIYCGSSFAGSIELARGKTEIQFVGSGKASAASRLFADIIAGALKGLSTGKAAPSYQISWVEDKQLLLNPLLSRKVFDIGFAWEKPNCKSAYGQHMCRNFFFSQPVYVQQNTDREKGKLRSFHAIISKSHPRARTFLYYLNAGLKQIKANGEYEVIVARHGAVSLVR